MFETLSLCTFLYLNLRPSAILLKEFLSFKRSWNTRYVFCIDDFVRAVSNLLSRDFCCLKPRRTLFIVGKPQILYWWLQITFCRSPCTEPFPTPATLAATPSTTTPSCPPPPSSSSSPTKLGENCFQIDLIKKSNQNLPARSLAFQKINKVDKNRYF